MKYLVIVLAVCLAWIGGTASAAPTYMEKLFERTGDGVWRFSDSGNGTLVTCYLYRDYYVESAALSCVRVK